MNTYSKQVFARKAVVAILLAASSLFLGACATQPSTSVLPSRAINTAGTEAREKPVTYAELHHMMARLADGPGLSSDRDSYAAEHNGLASSGVVATNP